MTYEGMEDLMAEEVLFLFVRGRTGENVSMLRHSVVKPRS